MLTYVQKVIFPNRGIENMILPEVSLFKECDIPTRELKLLLPIKSNDKYAK